MNTKILRQCVYCHKRLPRNARSDAQYCRSARCRVGAWRNRGKERARQLGHEGIVHHMLGTPRTQTEQVLSRWQRQRTRQGLPPYVLDPYCQAAAEEKIYEQLLEHVRQLRDEARNRKYGAQRPYFLELAERQVGRYGVALSKPTTHLGLAVLPPEFGGMAMLVTGTKR